MAIQEVQESLQVSTAKKANEDGYARSNYSDWPDRKPEQLDLIQQFNANLSQLEDLQARLSFVTSEIKNLIIRKKF